MHACSITLMDWVLHKVIVEHVSNTEITVILEGLVMTLEALLHEEAPFLGQDHKVHNPYIILFH